MKTNNYKKESGEYGLIKRLRMLRDLLEKGKFTKQEIFNALSQHYQSTPSDSRRLSRDINALRQLGYSVVIDRLKYTYSIRTKSTLILEDSDVRTLSLIQNTFASNPPIAIDVVPVLNRIFNALPERQYPLIAKQPPISILLKPAIDYVPFIETVQLLEKAIQKERKVQFIYPSLNEAVAIKHIGVEPYEIQFFDNHFYLIGVTPQAIQMMEFRIDRIRELVIMPGKSTRSRKRSTISFTYKLSKKIADQGISERFLNQKVEIQDDGSAIVFAEGYSEFRIIQGIFRYGEQAEILTPISLRRNMQRVIKSMEKLYEG